jgi:hypothetical protein
LSHFSKASQLCTTQLDKHIRRTAITISQASDLHGIETFIKSIKTIIETQNANSQALVDTTRNDSDHFNKQIQAIEKAYDDGLKILDRAHKTELEGQKEIYKAKIVSLNATHQDELNHEKKKNENRSDVWGKVV